MDERMRRFKGGIDQIYEEMRYMRIASRYEEEYCVIDSSMEIVWEKM